MDITPDVNVLRSHRAERVDFVLVAAEGIDNAFDANAQRVSVTFDPEYIEFVDNGRGIIKEKIEALFKLGLHAALPSTQLGRFGIGIKAQAINTGDVFEVVSKSADCYFRAAVNWRKVMKQGNWRVDDPHYMPMLIGGATGTTITISELVCSAPTSLEKVRTDLASRFYPAIREGRIIELNGSSIELLPDPPMTDVVEASISFSNGRSAEIRAGIVESESRLNKVHVGFRFRVIRPFCAIGCGEYGGLNKMYARVQISGPWRLAKFKDDLANGAEAAELEDAVYAVLKPILEKVSAASLDARLEEFGRELNARIPTKYAARPRHNPNKEKNAPAEKRKRKEPGVVSPEKSDPEGPARAKPRDRLLITFDGNQAEDGIGSYDRGGPNRPSRVNLSRHDPLISALLKARGRDGKESVKDRELALTALLGIAFCIFEHGRERAGQPGLFDKPFGIRIAKLFAAQDAEVEAA